MADATALVPMLLLQVSEGLDFADGNARGVIIVGIPFPHAKDLKVSRQPCLTVCTCHVGRAARLPPPTLPPLTVPHAPAYLLPLSLPLLLVR